MHYIILLLAMTLPVLAVAQDAVPNPDESTPVVDETPTEPTPVPVDEPTPTEPEPEPTPTSGEADDTIEGARRFRPNEKGRLIRSELLSPQDIDFYEIDLSEDGQLQIELEQSEPSGTSAAIGWRTELFSERDLAANLYTLDLPQATLAASYDLGLASGTYYMKVSSIRDDFAPSSQYRLTLTFIAGDVYEKTPNTTPAEATPIQLNKQIFGNLSSAEDKDFFLLSMPAEGIVNVTLRQQSIGTDRSVGWRLSLFSEFDLAAPLQTADLPETSVITGLQTDLFLGVGNYYLAIESLNLNLVPQTTYELRVASPLGGDPNIVCTEVLTYAIHPTSLRWVVFPTPCDVPAGWFSTVTKPAEVTEILVIEEPPRPAFSAETQLLTMPVVEIPGANGRPEAYQVQLRLLPSETGQPFQFEVVMESLLPLP